MLKIYQQDFISWTSNYLFSRKSLIWGKTWISFRALNKIVIKHLMKHKLHMLLLLFGHTVIFATPWTSAHQASLSFAVSQSLLKLMSTESVTHLI